MARLNVEDDWFIDIKRRRAKLIKLIDAAPDLYCDSVFKADGMALAAWRLAQDYRKHPGGLIPLDEWPEDLELFISAGLAERRADGIYVRGAGKHFRWLLSKKEAGRSGGKASGETRRAKQRSKTKQIEANASKPKQIEANASETNPLTLPLPLPLTQEDNPLSPPAIAPSIADPPAPTTKREAARAVKDEAGRIADAVLSIVLNPPRAASWPETEAAIRARVPEIGRRVVERMVGADGWITFVKVAQATAEKGNIHVHRAQLRDAIAAELRLASSEADA